MNPDPFDMMRQSVLAIQTQNELAAARATIAALRKELADAQENYHVTNSLAAEVRAENEEIHADYEALANEHTKLTERHREIKAEVERLRKAGDALAAWTLTLEHTYDHKPMDGLPFSSFLCVWHEAAKEGKPSDA